MTCLNCLKVLIMNLLNIGIAFWKYTSNTKLSVLIRRQIVSFFQKIGGGDRNESKDKLGIDICIKYS